MKSNLTLKLQAYRLILSFVLSAMSGFLLALPFFNGSLWLISWFSFIPLFFAWEQKSILRVFILSFIAGLVFFSCVIYWLIHVTFIGQILLIIYLSLYFGIFGLSVYFKRKSSSLFLLFFIPSLWVILEFLRSSLLTGFGWALLGYSQYINLPIIQIADITGVWGVSFLVMMVNVAIWQLISELRTQNSELRKICFLFSILCLLCSLVYGLLRLNQKVDGESLRVSVIQGNIPQELKWQEAVSPYILEKYLSLTKEASSDNPQLIIWPESSVPGLLEKGNFLFNSITDLVRQIKIPLLAGAITTTQGKFYNSAILISQKGRIEEEYKKLHLVPFGEYIPLKRFFAFAINLAPVPIGDFTAGKNYTVFSLGNNGKKTKFSVLICFEDVFPELSREFTKRGTNLLINITNDAWFKQSSAPYQHLQASVFRAIENRKFLIRAANTGISCFIDPHGKITNKVSDIKGKDIFVTGYKTQDVKINDTKTLYTKFGDFFVVFCFVFVVIKLSIKNKILNKA